MAKPPISSPAAGRRKQAVVVIHGMGEQRPMDTLHGFVDAVWRDEPLGRTGRGRRTWIVPDDRAGSHELRRITAGFADEAPGDVRTDFFEFYWADLMQGTTLQHLWSWVRGLLFRPPWTVPARMVPAWLLLWAVVAAAALILLSAAQPDNPIVVWLRSVTGEPFLRAAENIYAVLLWIAAAAGVLLAVRVGCLLVRKRRAARAGQLDHDIDVGLGAPAAVAAGALIAATMIGPVAAEAPDTVARLLAAGVALVLGVVIHQVLVPYLGDVARYVRAAPETVERRQAVRTRGLDLLRRLHERDEYRRIVIVGHSLGAVVAYDLLLLFWAECGPSKDRPPGPAAAEALARLDRFVGAPDAGFPLADYREAQGAVFDALRSESDRWLISDFVTLGSPLTHADFLLARNRRHLETMQRERLLATSPPTANDACSSATMLYSPGGTREPVPHHAALFAAVRWTNIYDLPLAVLFGDLVSGPARDNFGPGIEDVPVRLRRPLLCFLKWRFFTHTLYWDPEAGSGDARDHIRRLRDALDL